MTRKKKLKAASDYLSSKDPVTAALINRHGPCTLQPVGSSYKVLLKSVIGQQLSTKAAASIENRFYELFKKSPASEPPSAPAVLRKSPQQIRKTGISNRKVETIYEIARLYRSRKITEERLQNLDDEEVMKLLCSIRGVGPWTAEMVLMFSLDRLDHFSAGDLILRTGIEKHYGIDRNNVSAIRDFAAGFSPYRTVFCWYLWADHDGEDRGGWS